MDFELKDAVAILTRTPDVVRSLLGGLDEPWVMSNYGEETWSPFDIVGHLIHGEKTDWLARVNRILEDGDSKPFEPFDRYAQYEDSKGKTMAMLLDEFADRRRNNVQQIEKLNLTHDQYDLPGMHPALGPVTLRQLLSTWVVHDLHHIAQICKAMSYQYRDNVGAWKEYLGIIPK